MAPHSPSAAAHSPLAEAQDTNETLHCLSIVELLAQVFLGLPMVDIIRCKSVCRQWSDVIDSTSSLQRVLWMSSPSVSEPFDPTRYTFENGKIRAFQDGIVFIGIESCSLVQPKKHPFHALPEPAMFLRVNPLVNRNITEEITDGTITRHYKYVANERPYRTIRSKRIGMINRNVGIEVDSTKEDFPYRWFSNIIKLHFSPPRCENIQQSWMSMFLTDPPCSDIIVKAKVSSGGEFRIPISRAHGIRTGDIVRAIQVHKKYFDWDAEDILFEMRFDAHA
ncbi:hypothetical protein BU16DRAFT_605460 [Lophium mytilinum]|uniref:F-box domain-containing protein n=1 Tax=Lophium mytilinum TaxID=390894 RepID=A0A6A6R631_9PEZI|nr:hypothetical protein BU16DRAFT_605460 [Lophium mytilinum]